MTRPMTEAMDRTLNGLTASQRRIVVKLAAETCQASPDGLLSRLLHGLAVEVLSMQSDEAQVLHALSSDPDPVLEQMDARHPYPMADGPAITFDPDAS